MTDDDVIEALSPEVGRLLIQLVIAAAITDVLEHAARRRAPARPLRRRQMGDPPPCSQAVKRSEWFASRDTAMYALTLPVIPSQLVRAYFESDGWGYFRG